MDEAAPVASDFAEAFGKAMTGAALAIREMYEKVRPLLMVFAEADRQRRADITAMHREYRRRSRHRRR